MNKKQKKEASLFSSKKIEGYTVKPWSLGTLEELGPWFERVAVIFKERGISLDQVESNPQTAIFSILPEIKTVLSITLGEDIEVVKEFDPGKVTALILVIISQNLNSLKNSFAQISTITRQLAALSLSGR